MLLCVFGCHKTITQGGADELGASGTASLFGPRVNASSSGMVALAVRVAGTCFALAKKDVAELRRTFRIRKAGARFGLGLSATTLAASAVKTCAADVFVCVARATVWTHPQSCA